VNVKGEYTSVEALSDDVYCISGVKSDLTVDVTTSDLYASSDILFEDIGYGITDDGYATLV
jgi:hypothetical protein